uniref:Unc-50-like protein n=1 Tax=Ditylenchus dipsaci TaxID=166011 RepID=A0A915E182_9BILA
MVKNFGQGGSSSNLRGISSQSPTTSTHSFTGSKKDNYFNRSGLSTPASTYTSYISPDKVGCLTAVRMTAMDKLSRYFRRLVHIKQMDFEFAAWQMLYLLIHPQKVYRNFMYRKRTKDQWARDDPAFLLLLAASLSGSSVLFALALNLSFLGFVAFFLGCFRRLHWCWTCSRHFSMVHIQSVFASCARPGCGVGLLL